MKRKRLALLMSFIMALTSVDSTALLVSASEYAEEFQSDFVSEEPIAEAASAPEDTETDFFAEEPADDTPVPEYPDTTDTEEAGESLEAGFESEEAVPGTAGEDAEADAETPAIQSLSLSLPMKTYVHGLDNSFRIDVTIGYEDGSKVSDEFWTGWDTLYDQYGNAISIQLKDSQDNVLDWPGIFPCGTYTIELQCGEISGSTEISIENLEDTNEYRGELFAGTQTINGSFVERTYYKFVPKETGKYSLTGVESFIRLWQIREDDCFEYIDYNSASVLEKGRTYYFDFCCEDNTAEVTLSIVPELKGLRVDSQPENFIAGLYNFNITEGTELSFIYDGGQEEKVTVPDYNSYITSSYGYGANALITDENGENFSSYGRFPKGKYTVIYQCGEVESEPYTIEAINIEASGQYRKELTIGENTIETLQNEDVYYKFIPSETGRYQFKDTPDTIEFYEDTSDGYSEVGNSDGYNLKAGNTYYIGFRGGKYVGRNEETGEEEYIYSFPITVKLVPELESISVTPAKTTVLAYGRDETSAVGGAKVTLTYKNEETEELELTRWDNGIYTENGDLVYAEAADKDGQTYTDMYSLPAGEFSVKFVCGDVESEAYSINSLEIEESDLYKGALSEGRNDGLDYNEEDLNYYSFTPASDGNYLFKYMGGMRVYYRTDQGYDPLYSQYRAYSMEAGKTYYLCFEGYSYEEWERDFYVEILHQKKITALQVTPAYTEVAVIDNGYVSVNLEITYEDQETRNQICSDSYWDEYENNIYPIATKDGEDYSLYNLAPGTYSVQYVCGDVKSNSYELTVQTLEEAAKGNALVLGTQTIQNGSDRKKYYSFTPEKSGDYLFSIPAGETNWTDVFSENEDGGYDWHDEIWSGEVCSVHMEAQKTYYMGFSSSEYEETTLTLVKKPEVVTIKAEAAGLENLQFAEKLETPSLKNLKVHVTYDDGSTGTFTLSNRRDEYGNYLNVSIINPETEEALRGELAPGAYAFRITFGSKQAEDIPFTVTSLQETQTETLTPDEEKISENMDGRVLYSFKTTEEGRYEITFNVPVDNIRILDAEGNEIVDIGDGKLYRVYADLAKEATYYVCSSVDDFYPMLRVSAKKVAHASEVTVSVSENDYIAGLTYAYDIMNNAKAGVKYSDGSSDTLNNYEELQGGQIRFKVQKDGEDVDSALQAGTYQVTLETTKFSSGSAIGVDLSPKVVPGEVSVKRLNTSTLPEMTAENWTACSRHAPRQFYTFTAPEDGTYRIEAEGDIYSLFYEDNETGLKSAGDSVTLKKGDKRVVGILECYEDGRIRVTRVTEETPEEPDPGEKPVEEGTVALTPGMTDKAISIKKPGTVIAFTFTPDKTGYYVLSSQGDLDTYVTLYQGNEYVAEDDDGGSEWNFKLISKLEKGVSYRYRATLLDAGSIGDFTVSFYEMDVKEIASVELVPIKNADDLTVYQNIRDYYEVKVTYKDGTTEKVDLNNYFRDDYGNIIRSSIDNPKETKDTVVNTITVQYRSIFAESDSWNSGKYTITQKKPEALEQLTSGQEYKQEMAADTYKNCYLGFTPEEDGEYLIKTTGNVGFSILSWSLEEGSDYLDSSCVGENAAIVRLDGGVCYAVELGFYESEEAYTGCFEIHKAKEIRDIQLVKAPDQTGIAKVFSYRGLSLKGMEVEVTYKDGTKEILTGSNPDSSGRCLIFDQIIWNNSENGRAIVKFGDYRVYFPVKAIPLSELPLLVEEQENALAGEADESIAVRFVPEKTEKYFFYGKNCYSGFGILDENLKGLYPDMDYGYNLTKGMTYYLNVWIKGANPTLTPTTSGCVWTIITETEATCTEPGSRVEKCQIHGEERHTELPALGHAYTSETIEATCTSEGLITYTCSRCGEQRAEILPKKNHTWGETPVIDKEPTCTESGSESIHCTVCDTVKEGSEKELPASGHKYGEWETVLSATCAAAGIESRTCSVCGQKETKSIPATGDHKYGETQTTAATETENGEEYHICNVCGRKEVTKILVKAAETKKIEEVAAALEKEDTAQNELLDKVKEIDNQALIDNGSMELVTNLESKIQKNTAEDQPTIGANKVVAGIEDSEKVSVEGAAVTAAYEVKEEESTSADTSYHAQLAVTDPVSTETQYQIQITMNIVDSNDNVVKEEVPLAAPIRITLPIPSNMNGIEFNFYHIVDEENNVRVAIQYTINKENGTFTFVTPSLSPYVCVAADADVCTHENTGEWTTDTAALCETEGREKAICTDCGEPVYRIIAALGHDYAESITKAVTCTEDGEKTLTCKHDSSHTKTEKIPATGHKWNDGVVTKEPTCVSMGVKTFTCTNCGETKTENIMALGGEHNWQYETVTDSTCSAEGIKHLVCTKCHAVKENSEEPIAKKAHTFTTYVSDGNATCAKDGTKTAKCDVCGTATDTVTDTGSHANVAHTFTTYVTDGNATCTHDGTKTAKCSVCGNATDTVADTGSMTAHTWSNWQTVTEATVFAPETQKHTCTVCGKEETRENGKALTPTMKVPTTSLPMKLKQKVTKFAVTDMAKGDSVATWSSSNTKIVKVSGKANGTCSLTAQNKTGSAKIYITLKSGLKKTITVKVQKSAVATTKITGVNKAETIQKGRSLQLKPVLNPISSVDKITYSTSNKKVATVSSKGKITAKAPGTAKITVKAGKKSVSCTVTVPGITGVNSSLSLKKGKSVTLKPKKYGISSKVTYTSSKTSVASVSSKGKITAKKKGTAVITVKAGSYSVKCKVTVK